MTSVAVHVDPGLYGRGLRPRQQGREGAVRGARHRRGIHAVVDSEEGNAWVDIILGSSCSGVFEKEMFRFEKINNLPTLI